MIDIVRDEKTVDGKSYISLGIEVEENPEKYTRMWEAWHTGTAPNGFDVFDNDFGHTYVYYLPVIINGEKVGLVCADISVLSVNNAIIANVTEQFIGSFVVLVLGLMIMTALIKRGFLE